MKPPPLPVVLAVAAVAGAVAVKRPSDPPPPVDWNNPQLTTWERACLGFGREPGSKAVTDCLSLGKATR